MVFTKTRVLQPGVSPITAKLIEALKDAEEGDEYTDEQLTDICGKSTDPMNGPGYGNLQTAIRQCIQHHGKYWYRVRTAGMIRCGNDVEKVTKVQVNVGKIRRQAKRTTQVSATVNLGNLGSEDKKDFLAHSAQVGTIALMAKNSTHKKLTTRSVSEPPDMTNMLAMFTDK